MGMFSFTIGYLYTSFEFALLVKFKVQVEERVASMLSSVSVSRYRL